MKIKLIGLLFFLTTVLFAGDIAQVIDPYFSNYSKSNVPGASVLVIENGHVAYAKGYGMAELETKTATSVETNYRLASVSKAFTAMAVLILIDRGKLQFENILTDIFPDFPDYGSRITIRHLLHHQSGLRDYENLIPSGSPQVTDADVLRMMKAQSSTTFKPGTQYSYSNGGYCVLAQVVEKVSGQKYSEFVEDNIFQPLGMVRSRVYEKDSPKIENRAYGYTASGGGFTKTDQSVTSATQGDGGVYTSVNELLYWDRALEKKLLVSPALVNLMFTPGKLANGSATTYGFGWVIDTYRGVPRYSHTGSTIGFRTAIQRFPTKHFTVLVLINRAGSSPWDIARSIVDKIGFGD